MRTRVLYPIGVALAVAVIVGAVSAHHLDAQISIGPAPVENHVIDVTRMYGTKGAELESEIIDRYTFDDGTVCYLRPKSSSMVQRTMSCLRPTP